MTIQLTLEQLGNHLGINTFHRRGVNTHTRQSVHDIAQGDVNLRLGPMTIEAVFIGVGFRKTVGKVIHLIVHLRRQMTGTHLGIDNFAIVALFRVMRVISQQQSVGGFFGVGLVKLVLVHKRVVQALLRLITLDDDKLPWLRVDGRWREAQGFLDNLQIFRRNTLVGIVFFVV